MPSRPTHFEIPVDDPDRAEKFYGAVFGWTFDRYPGAPQYYGMATTGETQPGINGALFQRGDSTVTSLTNVRGLDRGHGREHHRGGRQGPPGQDPHPGHGLVRNLRGHRGQPDWPVHQRPERLIERERTQTDRRLGL